MKVNTDPIRRWGVILKRFMLIFLPLALFFGSLTLLFYYKDVNTEQQTTKKSEYYKINSQIKVVSSRFQSIITDLTFLTLQSELTHYLTSLTTEHLNDLADELLTFSSIKKIYKQIQYIDETGREVIRIDNESGVPTRVGEDKLKAAILQPPLKETAGIEVDGVTISSFDIGSYTVGDTEPIIPVIRFSHPILDNEGSKQGVLVLSHPVTLFMEDLETAAINSPGETFIVNPEGYYLNRPGKKNDSRTPPDISARNIESIMPEEWKAIKTEESGQFISPLGLITFSTIHPLQANTSSIAETTRDYSVDEKYLWKTISFVPQKVLAEWPEKVLGRILLLYSVCLVIIAICSIMLTRTSLRRRKAEKDLRENEEELRAINEAAANAIIAIDSNKNILHWNPAAERLFQYTATEVVEKPITSIISPPKHQSTFSKISRKFKLPEPHSGEAKTIELFGYKKDGTEFPVEVSFSAFNKDEQWHTVGIIRDISARKSLEKEVLRAHKFESLGVLSSGIAHDFNNLLTAIIGNINLVGKLSGTPPDSLELLKNAEKAARRAKALTQQLLTFSKDGMPIRKTTSVDRLIRDSVEYALHGSSVATSFDIPEDLLLVDIDAGQIGQVVQNIVTNSRQAISGSGTINICCRNVDSKEVAELPSQFTGKYIEIVIRDTGQGISKSIQSKIFDPYFTTKDNGSGLGLTIAHSILQRHDGHMLVHSEEDKGTTINVYLPAAVDQHLPQKKEKKRDKGKHFKILVVDNEEMLLNIANRMLVHLGHECVCARSAREALDVYKHLWKTGSPVDGVIVDLTLPGGMGGKETAGAIFDINSEARIIVSSGFSNDPVMVDFDEFGFCAAIAKPFDMDELSEVIHAVLE